MRFDATQLGRNIERRRHQLGLTQMDIADDVGVTQAAVHRWERGASSPPLHRLYRIAEYLHTTVAALLGEDRGANGNDHKAVA